MVSIDQSNWSVAQCLIDYWQTFGHGVAVKIHALPLLRNWHHNNSVATCLAAFCQIVG
jgi:hypothetical protein